MNIRLSNRSLSLRHRLLDEFLRFFDPLDDSSVKIHPDLYTHGNLISTSYELEISPPSVQGS